MPIAKSAMSKNQEDELQDSKTSMIDSVFTERAALFMTIHCSVFLVA